MSLNSDYVTFLSATNRAKVSFLGLGLSLMEMSKATELLDDKIKEMEIRFDELKTMAHTEQYTFKAEPNRKEKGHTKPFYRKGRW